MTRERRRSRTALAAAALVIALTLAGCAQPAPDPVAAQPAATTQSAGPLDAGGLQDPRPSESVQRSTSTPTRIRIPSIGVDSALETLSLGESGQLDAPVDWNTAGWYADGVAPGSIGPAIIAGHVDSPTAPAVFARVGELTPGAEMTVTMSDGAELLFVTTGSRQSAKSNFPTDEVYSNVPAPELRLITCAGQFDAGVGHYTDNLIVFAALRG